MVAKVKTFLSKYIRSLVPAPSYYHKILSHSSKSCLMYFVVLIFFLNALFFAGLFVRVLPHLPTLGPAIQNSLATYPKGLVITMRDGKMTTNDDRPYLMWMDYKGEKKLLAVVDDTAAPDKIKAYGAYILLSRNHVVFSANKMRSWPRAIPYRVDTVIDAQRIEGWIQSIQRVIPFALFLVVVCFFLLPLIGASITFLYIYILSILGFGLFNWFVDRRATFKGTFKIALHASTFPLTLFYILKFLGIEGNSMMVLPVVFVNLMIIFILTGVYEAYIEGDR